MSDADEWETFVGMARELPDHWAARRWPVHELDVPPEAFRSEFLAGMTKLADERHPGIRRMVAQQLDVLYRNERVRAAAERVRNRSAGKDSPPAAPRKRARLASVEEIGIVVCELARRNDRIPSQPEVAEALHVSVSVVSRRVRESHRPWPVRCGRGTCPVHDSEGGI